MTDSPYYYPQEGQPHQRPAKKKHRFIKATVSQGKTKKRKLNTEDPHQVIMDWWGSFYIIVWLRRK